MRVTICGPNLNDQSKGDFHVHAAGCGDLTRGARREPEYEHGWTIEADDRAAVVLATYGDRIAEGATFADCAATMYFMGCCAELPERSE